MTTWTVNVRQIGLPLRLEEYVNNVFYPVTITAIGESFVGEYTWVNIDVTGAVEWMWEHPLVTYGVLNPPYDSFFHSMAQRAIVSVTEGGVPLTGVSWTGGYITGEGSGQYIISKTGGVLIPVKEGYTFDPVSVAWPAQDSIGQTFVATVEGPPTPSTPTLSSPEDAATDYYLNTDSLLQMMWDDTDAEDISLYTVWFYDPSVGWMEQTDRSRYSIISYFMWLEYVLEYETTYQWFVRKTIDEVDYDSEIWSFTTTAFAPPAHSTRLKTPYGGGDPIEVPSGENNQLTVKRLIAAAQNKVFYEDV
jgi:hypothetical protein